MEQPEWSATVRADPAPRLDVAQAVHRPSRNQHEQARAVRFAAPSSETFLPAMPYAGRAESRFSHVATVTALTVPLYAGPQRRTLVGYTAIGRRVPALPRRSRCNGGRWVAVPGGAFMCTGDGAQLAKKDSEDALRPWTHHKTPRANSPTPYFSARAREGAPLFTRVPSADEWRALERGQKPKGLVGRYIKGTLLFAYTRTVNDAPEPLLELLSGELLRASDVAEHFPDPVMRGEQLTQNVKLPVAFTYEDATVYCLGEGTPEPCGQASRHARFTNAEPVEAYGQQVVMVGQDLAIPRRSIRIAEEVERPSGISADEQWIHIDLGQQTLVAYEGDRPVLATLVSSGKPEAATPRGLYQVNRVYQTKPMNGTDELGPYQVQEVPWAMYFRGNYAVHGAYWHDSFGAPRSHGCVNVPPTDAAWLFHWSRPRLPAGWTAKLKMQGPRVYITGSTPTPAQQVASDAALEERHVRSLN